MKKDLIAARHSNLNRGIDKMAHDRNADRTVLARMKKERLRLKDMLMGIIPVAIPAT